MKLTHQSSTISWLILYEFTHPRSRNLSINFISRLLRRRKPLGMHFEYTGPVSCPHDGRITRAKTHHYAFPRERQGGKRRIGGWLCDTRATPANGRAEPGRQTIDICVQNGRQERHPPYSKSPFAPSHVYPLPPPPPFSHSPHPSSSLHPSHVCPRSSLTSKPSHWLPTSQYYPHRPVKVFRSLSLFLSLFLSAFLSLPSFIRLSFFFVFLAFSFLSSLFFFSRISVLFAASERAWFLLSKMTPS